MDMLNFNKDHTIVFEGHCLPDVPLANPLSQYLQSDATITQVVREVDMTKKSPIKIKNETYGIYGYCDFNSAVNSYRQQAAAQSTASQNIKRLILKTDNDKANDLSVKLRRSLLKKCQNLRIRTDIQSEGLFFVKTWVLKLIPVLENELSPESERNARDEEQRNYDDQLLKLASFADDFVPFLAKN